MFAEKYRFGYGSSNSDIVKAYAWAVREETLDRGRAGSLVSTTGWSPDTAYYGGILLARLNGVKPPFRENDKLHVTSPRNLRLVSPGTLTDEEHAKLLGRSYMILLTVERVYYINRGWAVSLKELDAHRLLAVEAFQLNQRAAA